jgi:hypothetical protein
MVSPDVLEGQKTFDQKDLLVDVADAKSVAVAGDKNARPDCHMGIGTAYEFRHQFKQSNCKLICILRNKRFCFRSAFGNHHCGAGCGVVRFVIVNINLTTLPC